MTIDQTNPEQEARALIRMAARSVSHATDQRKIVKLLGITHAESVSRQVRSLKAARMYRRKAMALLASVAQAKAA